MKQYQAGYLFDSLFDVFERNSQKEKEFKKLTEWASYFDLVSRSNFENQTVGYSPQLSILLNLIQRGKPTKLNKYAFDKLVETNSLIDLNAKNDSTLEATISNLNENTKETIFKCFHFIDPRISKQFLEKNYSNSSFNFDSNLEKSFYFDELQDYYKEKRMDLGLQQLLDKQRILSSLATDQKKLENLAEPIQSNFRNQKIDFSIEFPYCEPNKPKGVVIEIDGPHHHNQHNQIYLDIERDKFASGCGWAPTVRITHNDFQNENVKNKLSGLIGPHLKSNKYIVNCLLNNFKPIIEEEKGRELLELCITPIAIARIQRCIIEAVAHKRININSNVIKIAILERDVPCAHIAFEDLRVLIENLNLIFETPLKIPPIQLDVFSTHEFIDSPLQLSHTQNISEFDRNKTYDLVIDIAILERTNFISFPTTGADEVIVIRSVHSIETKSKVFTTDILACKPFCEYDDNENKWELSDFKTIEGLEYLLQSVFRKQKFREGQLPILHNALQLKSVIGLLPTGGGKSLTYQLSALLQPGICLVIDPIRSLMKDQVDGLIRNGIDSCLFINSMLQGEEKRNAIQRMEKGEVQFVFISPERLQMQEFRDSLNAMFTNKTYFSYCVIDEAHCVSEWGHDFRTAYLQLGENAVKYCKTKNLNYLPLFGLTATASYDVLADVQRELSGNFEERRLKEDAIVRSEYSKRHELQYIIEDISNPVVNYNTIWELKDKLGGLKQKRLIEILKSVPERILEYLEDPLNIYSEFEWDKNLKNEQSSFEKMKISKNELQNFYNDINNAGLIFCPHTKGIFGVTDQFSNNIGIEKGYYDILNRQAFLNPGFFIGSGSDKDDGIDIQSRVIENQDSFINNETNLMVATKAFGMGIDKENIRYTVHVNYPGSIESFVQEAGRAGRDGKIALSYILFNNDEVSIKGEKHNHDYEINEYFHLNSFKGIQKEMTVIEELLSEVYFPDRTFEFENLVFQNLDYEITCSYWERENLRRIYVNFAYEEPLGYFDLNTLEGHTNFRRQGEFTESVNPELSDQLWPLFKNYIRSQHLTIPVHKWIQVSETKRGIKHLLDDLQTGESFELTVGFFNDISHRIDTLTKFLQKVIHKNIKKDDVEKMRANSNDAEAFIIAVSEKFTSLTNQKLDFNQKCFERDNQKGLQKGTTYRKFSDFFNGYRNKMDTEKAIYRLTTLGVIDDYTVDFNTRTFNLVGTKKDESEYKSNLKDYLLKYYSENTTNTKLSQLKKIHTGLPIRNYLKFLIQFVYTEIQKKRELAIKDMREACLYGISNDSVLLKEYIDLYFNSKYARAGYTYEIDGKVVEASLKDLTKDGTEENIELVWQFMKIVDEDPKAGNIDNTKHLRGACMRMLRNNPDNYTLLLLHSFSLYFLEHKNERYLNEAENLLTNGFLFLDNPTANYTEEELEEIFNNFKHEVITRVSQLSEYFENLTFDSIRLHKYLPMLQKMNSRLHTINKKLNTYA